ncbi:hypothetical protein D3C71_1724600 [compost metagenome]
MADLEGLVLGAQALPFGGAEVEGVIEFVERTRVEVAVEIALGFGAMQLVAQRHDLVLELQCLPHRRLHALGGLERLACCGHGALPQSTVGTRARIQLRRPHVGSLDRRIHC